MISSSLALEGNIVKISCLFKSNLEASIFSSCWSKEMTGILHKTDVVENTVKIFCQFPDEESAKKQILWWEALHPIEEVEDNPYIECPQCGLTVHVETDKCPRCQMCISKCSI